MRREPSTSAGRGEATGGSVLTDILKLYDPSTRGWTLTRDSEFWRTVAAAHALGERGAGKRVAVIDGGFDLTIPALAKLPVRTENLAAPSKRMHGTIVALLLLEVAPDADIRLYPVREPAGIHPARVEAAFARAVADGADIVNLSIGADFSFDGAAVARRLLRRIPRWPEMSEADLVFWNAEAAAAVDRWTDLIEVPDDPMVHAVRSARAAGATVVASAGNSAGHYFSPAVDDAAVSAGFLREVRTEDNGREVAVGDEPDWFAQSLFVDLQIEQPPELIGSSFASPLIAAAAALMDDPTELYAYRRVAAVGGLASGLMARTDGATWTARQLSTTHELFLRALNASPHRHVLAGASGHCTACALWEVQVLVDFGLFHLERYSFDDARRFLEAAAALAPQNPHARANLGMTLGCWAARAVDEGDIGAAAELLSRAASEFSAAVDIRRGSRALQHGIGHAEARRDEFKRGSADPSLWRQLFRVEDAS